MERSGYTVHAESVGEGIDYSESIQVDISISAVHMQIEIRSELVCRQLVL